MISEKDISNVKNIIEKSKAIYTSEIDKKRLDKLQREFNAVGDRYLKEVKNHDRL